jgi:hypothetical protein
VGHRDRWLQMQASELNLYGVMNVLGWSNTSLLPHASPTPRVSRAAAGV